MGVNQLTVTKHPEGSLMIFPRPAWESFRDKVMALPMSASGWKRIFLGNAMDVEIDGSSRVLIAPELRAAADALVGHEGDHRARRADNATFSRRVSRRGLDSGGTAAAPISPKAFSATRKSLFLKRFFRPGTCAKPPISA
jgi:hypothetical protein